MEALKRVIAKINTQFVDLTPSQRIAIGLCAVVVVGSLLWMVRWSAEPEYVRLLEEPLTREQLSLARQTLPTDRYKIVGEYILVSPDDRDTMMWQLSDAGALPADTSITFSKLIEDDSPFRPESENSFRRLVAKQNELAKVIASSPRVKSAEVFITDASNRRVNSPNVEPTASIKITMLSGQTLDAETVQACASLVAGAVPGLPPHNVSVIDGATLRPFKVPNPEDALAHGQLREKQKQEQYLRDKILDQLSYILGVRVNVSVQLDTSRKETLENSYAQPAVAEETTSSTETSASGPAGESGVGPNVGQSLAGASTGGSNTSDDTMTKFQDQPLARQTKTEHLPFALLRATASIAIPRSYVVGILMSLSGAESEPTEDEINARFESEKARVQNSVKNILMAERDEDVTVDLYPDLQPAVTVLPDGTVTVASSGPSDAGFSVLAGDYGPEIGLGLLALFGMFLLVRMARRSASEAAELLKASERGTGVDEEGEEILTIGSPAVGRATPTENSMLQAREIDDELLRANQLTEQVKDLVNNDPAIVAQMLRKWTEAAE